ncbi:HET-domain-containing protein, partial [Polyplosphaeria fusca]
LPTRVLEISGSVESPSVRLIETEGRKAPYCALSHCWGKILLLTTTRANIGKHLSDIPFHTLPVTFRDAIILSQGIGIPYLWIDSLCIIQDDTQDWEHEAALMGNLYENATLVIAAAGSENSTKGLFVSARPKSDPLELPFSTAATREESFLTSIAPSAEDRPGEHSPLSTRAWVLQEWYLARRLVFFMPGGISWRCREIGLNERGVPRDLSLYSLEQRGDPSWLLILQEYSRRRLTKKSDRLVALQGVVSFVQRSRKATFHSGIWSDRIMEQLLWIVVERYEQGVLDLPSWSWA